ncbi:MOB kinase activator 1B [Lagopus muta]|uniref:MOB kinase activator 1B n=1 Tax=Lagopus muta TaxID=64668 RepID=UPI00209D4CC3|nr:MOB kinase activator 1B [Lagopus muta]
MDADRPHCFIRNLGAFLIAARKLPPQPGAGLYLKWGAAPSGAHTHRAVTVSRAHRAEGCWNARFPTRDGLQRGTDFAASTSQPSAHLSAGGLGAPRHGEERSREGRAARGRRRVASPPRGALPAHARPAPPPRAAPSPSSSRSRSPAVAMSFLFGSRSSKTFKPKKNIPEGSHQYELLKHAEATLGSGNLRMAVMLPEGEDLNEWVAVNTVDFFNQINMLYGTITDFCTEESCPVMSAGPKYEYHWADGTNIKKPIKCSAPKYIDYLMTWVQDQLDDETLFPSKIGVPFPKNFMSVAKTILKRLFRVYAHIYHQHFDPVIQLQEEAHLNTSFKHFIFFVQEFNLIDRRELAPLQELIEKLTSKDR